MQKTTFKKLEPPKGFTPGPAKWPLVWIPKDSFRHRVNLTLSPAMDKVKPTIERTILRAVHAAEEKKWEKANVWELVITADVGTTVMYAERNCLPRDWVDICPPVLRRVLYYQELILRSLETGQDPFTPIYIAEYLRNSIGPAWKEIYRRGQQHIGFHVAMYLHIGSDNSVTKQLVNPLVALSWHKVPPRFHKDVMGQIDLTLKDKKRKWGEYYWTELFARALNGEMNIFPIAIRDDLTQAEVEDDASWVDVRFLESQDLEDTPPQNVLRQSVPPRADGTEDSDGIDVDPWKMRDRLMDAPLPLRMVLAVEKMQEENPEKWEGPTLKEIATGCDISDRWAKHGRKQAREIEQNYRQELRKKKKG